MKKILNIVKWMCVFSLFVVMVSFTEQQHKEQVFTMMDFNINESEDQFLSNQLILEFINQNDLNPLDNKMNEFGLNELENQLLNHPSVKKAEVFSTVTGEVRVKITQRSPVMRIQYNNVNYYLDEDGYRMPLSMEFTKRVLVASGDVTALGDKALFIIGKYIHEDAYLKAQIVQIFVDDNNDIVLIPRVGKHQIIFGDVHGMDRKFEKLLLFYNKVMPIKGWREYVCINLKYDKQVVCTKK